MRKPRSARRRRIRRFAISKIARDVTVAWLDARTAYQRLDLTTQLFAQASDTLDLAQARYNLGLSSMVELTQAQLNKTRAEIEQATARYEYQRARPRCVIRPARWGSEHGWVRSSRSL